MSIIIWYNVYTFLKKHKKSIAANLNTSENVIRNTFRKIK